jgi:hypothetical protein
MNNASTNYNQNQHEASYPPPFNGPPNVSAHETARKYASERPHHEASQNDSAQQYARDVPDPREETETLVPLEANGQQQPSTETATNTQEPSVSDKMDHEKLLIAQVSAVLCDCTQLSSLLPIMHI